MSVNSVSGSTLKRDLATVLQQARAAATQKVDTASFTSASQDAGTSQGAGTVAGSSDGSNSGDASKSSSTASTPALSNDLMASLLQLQSDFSQAGLQNGLAVPGDAASTADSSPTAGATAADSSQAANGAAPVHHHRGHHGRPPETDATGDAQAPQTGSAETDATTTSGTTSTADSTSSTGDGLQAFLQQVTKAITAYAAGGPAGIAAAALTTTAKA